MKLKEVVENLWKTAEAFAKLGIEPKPVPRHLIEPMAWNEVHGLALREGYDRRHFVPDDQGLICLLDTEANERKITNRYSHLLSETGATPIVRKKTLKNGAQVIDLPLLVAEWQITSSEELRKQVPKLYGDQPTEKGEPDYLKMGLGPQEIRAEFALGRLPSLHEQKRLKNSETLGGRVENVKADVANLVSAKASATGQRIGASAKNKLRQAPVVGLNLAKTTISAIEETPRVARDIVQLGIVGFAIGEAVTESLVEPVFNQALLDMRDKAIAVKDKVAALPKSPTDIVAAVIINQLNKS